jgi:hypothetical protein
MQAAFRADQVRVSGRFEDFTRISDEDDRRPHGFHFCPECGSQVFSTEPDEPDLIVVSVGSFADPAFPPPTEAGYTHRRHHWLTMPAPLQTPGADLWEPVRPLYAAGEYAEAAARGRELLDAHPGLGMLFYNTACCESLAGETDDAVTHLARAIELWDGCRGLAREDSDFDPIRGDPAFARLVDG